MASPRRKDPGKQQSSTATGVTTHLDTPIGDTATTQSPSVANDHHHVVESSLPNPGNEPQAQEQHCSCAETFEPSEAVKRYYRSATEGLVAVDKVRVLDGLLIGEDQFHAIHCMQSAIPAQQAPAPQHFGSYESAATTGGYSPQYTLPTEPRTQETQPTGPPAKKREADNTNEGSERAGGAHMATMQGAGDQRNTAAQTPQTTTIPAFNTDQKQRGSSNSLDNVQPAGQTKSLEMTSVPTTSAPTKPPAKRGATAASFAADREAAHIVAIDEALAKIAASTSEQST